MSKMWLVISRKLDGYISERVKLFCTLEEAKNVGTLMLHSKCVRFEIYEDAKEYMGDFRMKPIYYEVRNEI